MNEQLRAKAVLLFWSILVTIQNSGEKKWLYLLTNIYIYISINTYKYIFDNINLAVEKDNVFLLPFPLTLL